MANEAENDLAKAEPILAEAEKGLENLSKDKIAGNLLIITIDIIYNKSFI